LTQLRLTQNSYLSKLLSIERQLRRGEIAPLQENPELREWKQARKSHFKIPWRQVVTDGVTVF